MSKVHVYFIFNIFKVITLLNLRQFRTQFINRLWLYLCEKKTWVSKLFVFRNVNDKLCANHLHASVYFWHVIFKPEAVLFPCHFKAEPQKCEDSGRCWCDPQKRKRWDADCAQLWKDTVHESEVHGFLSQAAHLSPFSSLTKPPHKSWPWQLNLFTCLLTTSDTS